MLKNVIWFQNINQIGGVESVIWNVIKKYQDHDITIVYNNADSNQVKRFSKYARLIKFHKDLFIECECMFINYGYKMIENHFKAKKTYYIIHADYVYQNLECVTDPRFEYLAVSQWACDQYYKKCGIMPKLFPNPIVVEETEEPLLIISATRIENDKGKIVERMKKLAEALDKRGIPFLWLVFTNSSRTIDNKSIINVKPRLDITTFMKKADFVAQLSDSEACCMTALEAETIGTPMLVTKIPSFYEQGLNDDNAVFFDFDMSNIDECIEKMLKFKFDFTFTAKEDRWNEVLAAGKSNSKRKAEVKVIARYYDIELKREMMIGETFKVKCERAYYLESLDLVRQIA